jgi:signal transduction histidine kinase/FixJ family two-component response regulator
MIESFSTTPLTADAFWRRYRLYIQFTWTIPPIFGLSFLLFIHLFTFEQILRILVTPLQPAFIVGSMLAAHFYFKRFIRPVRAYLADPGPRRAGAALARMRRFPLDYWVVFIGYLLLAPASVMVSAQLYAGFEPTPVDWLRIHLVALIVSIIVGLPIFFLILDLFGRALGGAPLQRPHVTISTKVFLIGALVPLLIDTLLVQYFWTRTGYFTGETFLVWLLLELLAIGGSLIFVRSFGQSLAPLAQVIQRGVSAETAYESSGAKSTDEIGVLVEEFERMAAQLRESYSDLEQKVSERTQELMAANRAKSRFLAAASHDLRQPMHALGLFVAQLKNRVRGPESAPLILRVETAVVALQGLLDALLDVSRLDAGVVTANLTGFDANAVLTRIENGFVADAKARGLRFRIARSSLVLHSDPLLLERILINLVANALRYTHSGGILIGCRRRGRQARIEVWDSGIGIPAEHQQAIFQEFYQVSNPERDRHQGLGLGLSIAARLARLLGGRVDVRSLPGRGSVFAVEVARGQMISAVTPISSTSRVTDSLYNALVLVVDDDALVCEAVTGLLAQWRCTVVTAASGKQVQAALARQNRVPDAVLCDYHLPDGETGGDVIRQLRDRYGSNLPVALITGDTTPERLRHAKDAGIPLLHKPVQPARLRALLEHLISSRREGRQATPTLRLPSAIARRMSAQDD